MSSLLHPQPESFNDRPRAISALPRSVKQTITTTSPGYERIAQVGKAIVGALQIEADKCVVVEKEGTVASVDTAVRRDIYRFEAWNVPYWHVEAGNGCLWDEDDLLVIRPDGKPRGVFRSPNLDSAFSLDATGQALVGRERYRGFLNII